MIFEKRSSQQPAVEALGICDPLPIGIWIGSPLGHPRATLGPRKGHPSATQGPPKRQIEQVLCLQRELKKGRVGVVIES